MTRNELVSRYLLARQLWWQHTLEQLDAQAVAEVVKTLEAVKRDIRKRLEDDAEGLAQVTDWTPEQMRQVEAWADEVLASARGTLLTSISEATVTSAAASLAAHNAILSFDGSAAGVQTVGLTREQIVAWFDDTTLGAGGLQKWIDTAMSNGVKSSILQALRQSGVEGEGIGEVFHRVMASALDAGFAITQREAVAVTRTFIQTANVRAQEETYKANEKLLRGYKRVETLDNRTCLQCALSDGAEYAVGEERPRLPAHPMCRGIYTPLVKSWEELGISGPDLEEAARPWVMRDPGAIGTGGQKILYAGTGKANFEGWWRSLSAEEKAMTSLGTVRTKLLESGAVKWDQLWDKRTGLPLTLEQLGFGRSAYKNILA